MSWSPADIDLEGWWDASDSSTITSPSDAVEKWADKSGKGEDLVQTVAANKPTYNATTGRKINSLPVVDFDGDDYMEKTSFPILSSGDVAVFMVAIVDVVNHIVDSVFSFDATNDFQFDGNNATQFDGRVNVSGIGSDVNLTGGPFAGPSIYNTNFDFSGSAIYNAFIDGTQRAVNTAYTTKLDTSQTFRIFTNRGAGQFPDGAVAEVIIVKNPSSDLRILIEGYLAHKWGIEANLPGGHLYEDAPPNNSWTPSQIATEMWNDAHDSSTITESGGDVSQWDDKSGNSLDLVQATASKKPETNLRTQAGKNVIDFDKGAGSGEFMENTSPSGIRTADHDVYIVMKRDVIGTDDALATLDGTSSNQIRFNRFDEYSIEYTNAGDSGGITDTGGDTNPHIINGRYSGSNVQLFKDGTQVGSNDAMVGTVTLNDFLNLCADAFGGNTHDGWVAELVWSGYKVTADRELIEGYLAWKWGLEGNLPGGHTYEDSPPLVVSGGALVNRNPLLGNKLVGGPLVG